MLSQEKEANAIGGKTARACNNCLIKRARWFCAAYDAFLCQSCDSSVHSANQLSSRHQRVLLQTSSSSSSSSSRNYFNSLENSSPSWHQSVTRKPRTRRQGSKPVMPGVLPLKGEDESRIEDPFRLVPEIGTGEESENEEQMVLRVPVFDSFDDPEHVAEFGNIVMGEELNALLNDDEPCSDLRIQKVPSCEDDDKELVGFAADVESLLGREMDEDFGTEVAKVKVEDEDEDEEERGVEKQKEKALFEKSEIEGSSEVKEERKMLLRLNYEAVITAWDDKGSPWSGGCRPECNPDGCWPGFLGMCIKENQVPDGIQQRVRVNSDRAREASREKRRTRLFSSKIRYQVRKLNAERRPRMKGRFVKRTSILTDKAVNGFEC